MDTGVGVDRHGDVRTQVDGHGTGVGEGTDIEGGRGVLTEAEATLDLGIETYIELNGRSHRHR